MWNILSDIVISGGVIHAGKLDYYRQEIAVADRGDLNRRKRWAKVMGVVEWFVYIL